MTAKSTSKNATVKNAGNEKAVGKKPASKNVVMGPKIKHPYRRLASGELSLNPGYKFQNDVRDNNGLHALYVGWAQQHLMAIAESISKFESFSNLNMIAIVELLQKARNSVIKENAAYAEAALNLDKISSYIKMEFRFDMQFSDLIEENEKE